MATSEPPIQKYMKMSDQDSLDGYWFDVLGWVAYYFAKLEGASYVLIESLENVPAVRDVCFELGYTARCRVAAGLVAAHVAADMQLAADWAAFWPRATAAASIRNKVLHNPLTKDLLAGEQMGPEDGVMLVKVAGRPILKLGAVQAFSDELVKLNQELAALMNRTALPASAI